MDSKERHTLHVDNFANNPIHPLQPILNALPEKIVILDEQGKIIFVNHSWVESARIHGNKETDFKDLNYFTVRDLPDEAASKDSKKAEERIRSVLNGNMNDFSMEYSRHLSGTTKRFLMKVKRVREDNVTFIIIIHSDISKSKFIETELGRVNRVLKTLDACNRVIKRTESESVLLEQICQIIVEEGEYLFAWIGYVENDKDKTIRIVTHAGCEEGYLDSINLTWADTERGKGPAGKAVRSGCPSITKNVLTDPDFKPWAEEAQKRGYQSAIAVPLKTKEKTIGVMAIYSGETESFDEEEQTLLIRLADDLAYGIELIREKIENQKTEQEKKKLEKQFYQSQKMEAIGQLAGGVAHDFNNLIMTINGYAEFLLQCLDKHDSRLENVEEIINAGKRAASLTRQLLVFSRKQIFQPEILDLNHIVAELEKMLRRLIGENIKFKTVTDPNLGKIKADRGQIELIIINLAVNARDAMFGGGKLTIETSNVELDEVMAKQYFEVKPGHYVMLSVSDSGIGMDEETLSHLFEAFYTTKEPGKGTGLGLATVYGIVKQCEGYIRVYSEPAYGSTFKILFPCVGDMDTKEENPKQNEPMRGTETILLVEDEEKVRKLVFKMLEDLGYNVLSVSNGMEAIRFSEEYKSPIHLLVTDMIMPEMGGTELANRLALSRPRMKVIYMSGYTNSKYLDVEFSKIGGSFLQKPFSAEILAKKIREILDKTHQKL